MPPIDAPHRPARRPRRPVVHHTPAPQLSRPELIGRRPAAPPAPKPPSPSRARSIARSQEHGYRSQGRQVERQASRQHKRSTPARVQARSYRSQGRQVERQANRQFLRAAARMRERSAERNRLFGNPLHGLQSSEDRAIRSLSALYYANPKKYMEARQRAHDLHVFGVNIEKPARDVGHALGSAAHKAGQAIDKFESFDSKHIPQINRGNQLRLEGMSPNDNTRVSKEILDLAANAPTSLYLTGTALYKAGAKHDPRDLKRLAKDYAKHDAIVAAAQGHWREALKRGEAHPVSTALELSGGKALIGRTLGAAARRAPSAAIREYASTARPNLKLYPKEYGDGPEIARTYSRDLINNRLQKANERRAAKGSRVRKHGKHAGTQRRPPRDPHTYRGVRVVGASGHGAPSGVGKPESALTGERAFPLISRRIDTRTFSQDRASLSRKNAAEHATRKALKPHKGAETGVQLVAESIVRVDRIRKDLHNELLRLTKESKKLTDPERKRLNSKQRKDIREMLGRSDADLERLVRGAQDFADLQRPVQARGVRAGAFTTEAVATRRKPFIQTHVQRPARVLKKALSAEERRIQDKALRRRYRQGKPLPPRAAKIAANLERKFEQQQRQRGKETIPGQSLAEAVARIALRDYRIGKPHAIRSGDFERAGYFKDSRGRPVTRPVRVAARPLTAKETALAAKTAERVGQRSAREPFKGTIEGGPVLVTHRPGPGRRSARLQSSAPFLPTKTRSGRAQAEGSREVGRNALVRQAVTSEAEVTAVEGFNALDREFGIPASRRSDRRYASTYAEAAEVGRRKMEAAGGAGPKLIPVNIDQLFTFGPRLRARQEQGMPRTYQAANDIERQVMNDTWAQALNESGRGRWILMPEDEVVRRIQAHASPGQFGPLLRPLHSGTQLFKDIVLTSSSPARWLSSNVYDLSTRSMLEGITPLDIARGRRAVHANLKLTPEEQLQFEHAVAALTGGGFFHANTALSRAFRPRGYEEPLVRTILSAPWRAWKGGVYFLEQQMEELPQYGAIGKALRRDTGRTYRAEDGAMKRDVKSLLKLHDQQIDSFAMRLATDRAHEARIQKLTEDVIGRWGKVSPTMRRSMLLAPFAQWLGAAVRYVFVTLPVHHPIKTAILAGITQMTEDERKALGLSYFAPRQNQAQDYQMGMLPIQQGRNQYGPVVSGIRTKTALSFGTAADAFAGDVGGFLMPQFAGALDAFAGTSFTEEPLVYPDWWPVVAQRRLPIPPDERQKIGLGMLLESMIPFASAFRRAVLEKGRSAEPYSTILTPAVRKKFDKQTKTYVESPGTALGGILEWLHPYPPMQRLYTYGTSKAIEEQGIAGDVLDKWRKTQQQKKATLPSLRGPVPTQPNGGGIIDLRGTNTKPKASPTPGVIPLR